MEVLSLIIVVVIIFLISQLDSLKCKKVKRFTQGHLGSRWGSWSRTGQLQAEAGPLATKNGANEAQKAL